MTTKPDYLPVGTRVTLHTHDSFNGMEGKIVVVDQRDPDIISLCYRVRFPSGHSVWFRHNEVREITP